MRIDRVVVLVVIVGHVALPATLGCSRDEDRGARASASSSAAVSAPSRLVSCDRVPSTSLCSEYSGSYLAQNEAVLSATCAKLGGAFVQAECPNTSVLGSCTLSTTEVRKFYGSSGGSFDEAKAASECTTSYKGKWAPFK
ncbi:MAG: hypothetical protein JST00_04205 [Deltaproteobacteria bacterium]|nr:hypothetical protein [Deltaproteobacteria bacterium]